ncbi:MAG: hypothetical protein L6Q75_20340 [Burkholderiaceae bacterium]|nr:hypothetical protein [Burkholderiaceae bacterium]
MGRPKSPLRVQLFEAFERLNNLQGPVTYLEAMAEIPGLSPKSSADRHMVRRIVSEMCRAGDLVFEGERSSSCGKPGRPYNLLLVSTDWRCRTESAGAELAKVFAGWGPAAPDE